MANGLSDDDLPDVYGLSGIKPLLRSRHDVGAEDARNSQAGEAK